MARSKNSDFIDIKSTLNRYLSKWYWFVISAVVCVALGFLFIKVKQPEYAVKANVLISQQKEGMADAMGALSDLFGSDGYVEDEIFMISSHSLYAQVAKELRLNVEHKVHTGFIGYYHAYPEYPVDVVAPQGLADTLRNSVSFKISVSGEGKANIEAKYRRKTVAKAKKVSLPYNIDTPVGQFTVMTTPHYPSGESVTTKITFSGYDAAAESLDLNVHNEIASKRSNVISLSINTTNPDYGKDVLNDIIEKYNLRAVSQKNNQGELTANFLNNRIDLVSKELTQAETNVEQYKKLHNIVDVATESAFQTKKRARLEEELLAAETQLEIISLTTDFLRDPANAFNLFPMTVDNEALQANIQSYNDIILARNELIKTASPQNEYLRQMEDRIKALRANILESTYKQRQSAEIALRDVKREMNSLENSLGGIPEQEREYRNLYRQLSIKSEIYMFLLKRSEENAIILANAAPKGLIIDEAYTLSEPLGLSKKMILLLAFCFGLVIPPIFFASRKLIYNRFESREDVERVTDVPILGEMCIDKSGSRLVVGEDATTSSAELFRLMRTNLLFILNDARDKVVLITSTEPGEGKSFISLNLAASMALLGNKVLLIGMDVRRPQLARYLGINPRYGLTQYLSNQNLSLNDIIVKAPETAGLDVIVAGPVPPNPAELLLSEKVDSMFAELRNIYDYIIVDTAPIGSVSDTFTLNRLADASIYVCRANHTSLSALESVNEIYEQHRLKKLSLVINGTNSGKSYGYHSKQ